MTKHMLHASLATCETLYRLALLTLGDAESAETTTWKALLAGKPASSIAELAPLLLAGRSRRWHYQPSPRLVARTGTDAEAIQVLLETLARLQPEQRLALGLVALRSMPWAEAAQIAASGGRRPADPRPQIGVALGLLPPSEEASPVICARCVEAIQRDEQGMGSATRQHLMTCEACQAVRASWQQLNDLLRAVLPALFVIPPDVLRRFSGPPPTFNDSRRWKLAALLGGTLVAVVLFILLSGSGEAQDQALQQREALTTRELIERSLDRFRQRPPGGSVVHEITQFEFNHPDLLGGGDTESPVTLERWYDYGSPARLRVRVRRGEDVLYDIASNGQGQIQSAIRRVIRRQSRMTVNLPPALEAQYQALFRQPFSGGFIPELILFKSEPALAYRLLYAARSGVAKVMPLGSTTALGRPAWLLNISLPDHPVQHLLSIDQETYAVVDIQEVAPDAEQEGRHPWRMSVLEVLESVPDSQFELGSSSWGSQFQGAVSPLIWMGFEDLDELSQQVTPPAESRLLLPAPGVVPSELGTIFWDEHNPAHSVVTYWGESHFILLTRLPPDFSSTIEWTHEEAGRRFAVETLSRLGALSARSLALRVDLSSVVPDAAEETLLIQLSMPELSHDERLALGRSIIRSLAVADQERLESFLHFATVR